MSARTLVLLTAASSLLIFSSVADAQRPSTTFIWPLSRSPNPIAPVMTTYGPRVDSNGPDSYSFHRGIDIPTKEGSPVYAIAEGVVRLAGSYDYYQTPVVQLRHYKNAMRTCKNGGCFYSNYMHLGQIVVAEGKSVKQGELLGYTGTSPEGIPHLHFEIRNDGVWQKNCIHPLTVLPYQNRLAPKIEINSLKVREGGTGALTVTLRTARSECDLIRVNVTVFDLGRKKVERSYDMVALNFNNTPEENPNGVLHLQDFQNVIIQPKPLDAQQDCELSLVFYDLPDIDLDKSYQIKVEAFDARGKSSDVSGRLRAEKIEADDDKQANAVAAKPLIALDQKFVK